ncbi:MAG TPA: YciI family protein [Dehalococcoidia bacterium]|nr:YciI family protein [Dehalococcoidia bacterium]
MQRRTTTKYVLLVYQGTTPLPTSPEDWATLSEDEQKAVYADYNAINHTAGVTPGLPLGLPEKATTVRVKDGKTVSSSGPFVDSMGAVAGYLVFEADSVVAAIELAGRVPAARLGGAVEVRPAEPYW